MRETGEPALTLVMAFGWAVMTGGYTKETVVAVLVTEPLELDTVTV